MQVNRVYQRNVRDAVKLAYGILLLICHIDLLLYEYHGREHNFKLLLQHLELTVDVYSLYGLYNIQAHSLCVIVCRATPLT